MSDELQSALDRLVDGTPATSPTTPDDDSLNATSAAVVRALVPSEAPSPGLQARLRQDAAKFAASRSAPAQSDNVIPFPRRLASSAELNPWFPRRAWGWQIAAAFALLLAVGGWFQSSRSLRPIPVAERRLALLRELRGVQSAALAPGSDRYAGMEGDVVWSSERQDGFLRLLRLPANDPRLTQYQLWIVDPERDDQFPVDAGVFDIPPGGGETVVRFVPRLPVSHPTTFVITREQPGGVVKSRATKPVAIARL